MIFPNTSNSKVGLKNSCAEIRRKLKELGLPKADIDSFRLDPILTAEEREKEEVLLDLYELLEQYENESN